LNIFFSHKLLVINCSREEFLEIDFAISIKITLFDYGFPFAIVVEGATEKTTSFLDFLLTQASIVICIDIIESIFQDLQISFLRSESN